MPTNTAQIISPSIDLIEFKSGRGNVFLEAAVPLAKALHKDIIRLGKRLDDAATSEENLRLAGKSRRAIGAHQAELMLIIEEIKALLAKIDRDVPSILLAITNSGEKMNSTLSPGMSPSRMMQASWFLNFADFQFAANRQPVQVGPTFSLSLCRCKSEWFSPLSVHFLLCRESGESFCPRDTKKFPKMENIS